MHQHLVDGLVNPCLILYLPHPVEKEHCHENGVNPHLIFIEPYSLAVPLALVTCWNPFLVLGRQFMSQSAHSQAQRFKFPIVIIPVMPARVRRGVVVLMFLRKPSLCYP